MPSPINALKKIKMADARPRSELGIISWIAAACTPMVIAPIKVGASPKATTRWPLTLEAQRELAARSRRLTPRQIHALVPRLVRKVVHDAVAQALRYHSGRLD